MLRSSFPFRQLLSGLCTAAVVISGGVHAQAFPTRPITIVAPYQPGTTADVIARAMAEVASKQLGQPIVIDNKPGAEGLLGANDVIRAAPDGYRLLWGGAWLMAGVARSKNWQFDPITAFTPVTAAVDFSFFLYVHPSFPAKNMSEFIAYVRANPGKVTYATGNATGLMTMADVAYKNKLNMVQVQYKGETSAVVDLLANRVQAMFATASNLEYAKAGKLRILATTLPRRSPLLPDVPTLKEAGLPEVEFGGGWLGIFAPAGTPKPIVERLNKAFVAGLNDPGVKARMESAGLVYTPYNTPEQLAKFTKDQRDLYQKTVENLNLKLD